MGSIGRGCCGETRYRSTHRAARVERALASTWIQGSFTVDLKPVLLLIVV